MLKESIEKAQNYFLRKQHKEGYWVGLLEADVSVVSGFIPLIRIFGVKNPKREKKAYNYFIKRQNEDGSWSMYFEGSGSLDVTVQTYFCLKIIGLSQDDSIMQKARNFILTNGGVERTNTYTKIILALFGQYPWSALPIIPPEIIFLPRWFYINIYDFASWTRATILAFSIILTIRPIFEIKETENIFELYKDKSKIKTGVPFKVKKIFSLENIFLAFNSAVNLYEKLPQSLKISRKSALKKVEEWIVSHQESDGSWGGIMLPWLFSLVALKCIGYSTEHPIIKKGLAGLEDFIDEDEENFILQPATSPVWDTAWTILALSSSGINHNDSSLKKGAEWLLQKQVKVAGDWKVKNPKTQPGCWSFEFENQFYPDVDDTAIVCCALNSVKLDNEKEKNIAIVKGINWILDMQNINGSLAAFDRDNCKTILKFIPYADFITPLDFGSPDITAHVLYAFGKLLSDCFSKGANDLKNLSGVKELKDLKNLKNLKDFLNLVNIDLVSIKKKIKNATKYLINSQEKDGSWYGRWGVNYIYGTSKVLQFYEYYNNFFKEDDYFKKDNQFAKFKKAVLIGKEWLESIINDDGGWGESCDSYELNSYEKLKNSTASQTAWAVLGILAVEPNSKYAEKGINFLLETQNNDGSWTEHYYTGGGFPRAFYLKYELYKDYFPLLALSKFRKIRNDY